MTSPYLNVRVCPNPGGTRIQRQVRVQVHTFGTGFGPGMLAKEVVLFRRRETGTRLAHLCQSQGKTDEARDLLTSIYGWFIAGFDTADLKEVKVLFDELS